MGRGRLSMNLIPNRRSRISTFKKRKNCLMKKAYELSTLCDVRTCVLIHGPASLPTEEDHPQSDLQFHSWPSNPTDLEAMIRAYKATSNCNLQKRKCFDLTDFYSDRKRKIESETCKLREKIKWDDRLDGLSEEELREFMEGLDAKIEASSGMICLMEGDYGDLFGELCPENRVESGGDLNGSPSVDDLLDSIPSGNHELDRRSDDELGMLTIGGNPNPNPNPNPKPNGNEEDVMGMDDEYNNIRYLEMALEEAEEDKYKYMAEYENEFDYYCNNNIEHLMIPTYPNFY